MTLQSRLPAGPAAPRHGVVRPLGLGEVEILGGFWANRRQVNGTASLEHCVSWLERLGWVANFDLTAEGTGAERAGREFADSETFKVLEACAWEAGGAADPAQRATAERLYRSLADRVVAAQSADGYLNTRFGGPGQEARFSDLQWGHELYCAGHLIQAAVARARTVGEDELVRAARRVADGICETFGPGGRAEVCGHPEIETALVELSRVTGEARYLETAGAFLDRRGRGLLPQGDFDAAYFQDDVPIRAAEVLRGHAVRALYLTTGALDYAVDTHDSQLLDAVVRQWDATVARRTYVTGGMGSRRHDESFGDDFELPADGAYAETCAGVASVMLAWRLLLATGEPRFADLIERTLYNVVAAGVAEDGRSFFYANPLHQRRPDGDVSADVPHPRPVAGVRAPWFTVSCCPTNTARLMASLPGYFATADADGIQIHQYATARIRTVLDDGTPVGVHVETDYPTSGRVVVTIDSDADRPWTLSLRVPSWAHGATLTDGDSDVQVDGPVARVRREFRTGDRVVLTLPMTPRWTWPDPRIDGARGTVAVERGPVVLCLESVDLPEGVDVDAVAVHTGAIHEVAGRVTVTATASPEPADTWPYGPAPAPRPGSSSSPRAFELPLVPYHRWAGRGPTAMRVWLPESPGSRADSESSRDMAPGKSPRRTH